MTGPPADFAPLRKLILERTGIVLESDKDYLFESRLLAVVRREGFASYAELVERVDRDRDERLRRIVIEVMATGETSFYRDLTPFEALRTTLLPELLERVQPGAPVTIWSAACSTGQEPYSLAMMLIEHFPTEAWRVKIIATDFSLSALERARSGLFHQLEVNRGLPAPLLVKYFHREGMDWFLSPVVREMVEFRELNLVEPFAPLPRADIILLRNVLIYFGLETKRAVLLRVSRAMAPLGALFLGGAETILGFDLPLERASAGRASFFRSTAVP